jgi:DNA replication initiation complex subunit (GINS family)
MLSPERELFEKIKIFLEEARKKILNDKKDIKRKDIKKKDATEEIKEKAVPEEHFKQEEKNSSSFVAKETEIVRITKDLPSFVGADMQTYSLKREDVVTLPKNTAEILIKQGNALRVCLQ